MRDILLLLETAVAVAAVMSTIAVRFFFLHNGAFFGENRGVDENRPAPFSAGKKRVKVSQGSRCPYFGRIRLSTSGTGQ